MAKVNIRKWQLKQSFAVITVLALTFGYVGYFHEQLLSGDWLYLENYARIVAPDTFLYKAIANQDSFRGIIAAATVKNSLSSAVIWRIAGLDWFFVAAINGLLLFLIGLYMAKIAAHFDVDRKKYQKAILLFIVMPASIMYSVGALKELPSALLMLAVVHGLLSGNYKSVFISAFLLVVVRYQLVAFLLIVGLAYFYGARSLLRTIGMILLLVAAAYPLIKSIPWFSLETAQNYRDIYGGGGIGQHFEYLRDHVPGLSAIGIFVRVIQTLFEPIISFTFKGFSLMEAGRLNLYGASQFVTVLFLSPYIFMFFRRLGLAFLRSGVSRHIQFVFGFVFTYLVLVGGFSFIHHRYAYPIFPLIIIASLIPIKKVATQTTVYTKRKRLSW